MTVSKPEVVAWMWRDINGDVQFNYMHPNGEELIRLTDHKRLQAETERLQAARAADKAGIVELVEALESMTCAYRMAIQTGHARITALGGDCDSVDRMLADFPDYGRSVELYKSCRASLAQQGKEGET